MIINAIIYIISIKWALDYLLLQVSATLRFRIYEMKMFLPNLKMEDLWPPKTAKI